MRPESPRSRRERGPKGRIVDDAALAEVRALLGTRAAAPRPADRAPAPDSGRFGCLEARHLRALADEMRLSQAEVYEVASFYDHFDIVKEGEPKPAPVTIRVCESISCMIAGADALIESSAPASIRSRSASCAPRASAAARPRLPPESATARSTTPPSKACCATRASGAPTSSSRSTSRSPSIAPSGGYELYESVRSGELSAEAIIEKLQSSGLRGLGGAGFPPGKKWQFVRSYPGPALDVDQRRRGRARHFQGPLVPRARPAPHARRRVDRRSCRRGAAHLFLYAQRVSRRARDPAPRDRRARGRRHCARRDSSSCAAAPARTSAAKRAR